MGERGGGGEQGDRDGRGAGDGQGELSVHVTSSDGSPGGDPVREFTGNLPKSKVAREGGRRHLHGVKPDGSCLRLR
ncbi:hypothetical protein Airi01_061140 [Actinoallomurus iriomotensis]|uniref:Uncharacterized protein n=1 Tax=Actinoallomurus iriomotensis TaxID=478107 RepID=A0A9W6RPL8_9ACTN|nr:hypothetical protein Airi01_061140 [Actinoallomurus iriomotensis]